MDINIENTKKLLLMSSNHIREVVTSIAQAYTAIKWKTVSFIIPTEPAPSHRLRLCGYRVYVPGAAKNQAFFQREVLPKLKGLFIDTPLKIKVDIYVKTPVSFTKTRKCLAEMKIFRPWAATSGDVDNYEKAVYDMMQPNEKRHNIGIMSNDSLIIESHTNKYYSITPRYEVTISYMDRRTIREDLIEILRIGCFEEVIEDEK